MCENQLASNKIYKKLTSDQINLSSSYSTPFSNFSFQNSNELNCINKSQSSEMYLVESSYSNSNLTSASNNLNLSNSKNLVNNHHLQTFNAIDSQHSCKTNGIESSQQLASSNFNCESDCLLAMNQQQMNYQHQPSYIYSNDKLNCKLKSSQNSIELISDKLTTMNQQQPMLNSLITRETDPDLNTNKMTNNNNLLSYDYVDNKFDNLFYSSSWNSNESINNLTYTEPLDTSTEIDYFMLTNSRSNKQDDNDHQTIEPQLTLNSSSDFNNSFCKYLQN